MELRTASPADAPRLSEIYAPYVQNTAISFEFEAPSAEEFGRRIAETLKKYPYLVIEEEGRILGYAYAGPFHTRAAFSHSAEISIYVDEKERGRGLGRLFYNEIEKILARQNIFRAYASIAVSEKPDPYLTDGSIRFHEAMGYRKVAEHHECGYKFGHWYSLIYVEKELHSVLERVEEFIPFPELGWQRKNIKI